MIHNLGYENVELVERIRSKLLNHILNLKVEFT